MCDEQRARPLSLLDLVRELFEKARTTSYSCDLNTLVGQPFFTIARPMPMLTSVTSAVFPTSAPQDQSPVAGAKLTTLRVAVQAKKEPAQARTCNRNRAASDASYMKGSRRDG